MIEIVICACMLVYYMAVFLSFGSLVGRRMKEGRFSVTLSLMFGFFLYYGLFQVAAVPCTFLKVPLRTLAVAWMVFVAAVVAVAVKTCWKLWLEGIRAIWGQAKENPFWALLPLGVLLVQSFYVVMWQTDYWDATYYIGEVSLSVYTNTIGLYDPLSRELRTVFDIRHCFATYLVHDAVVCKLFGIHPLVEMKTVMGVVVTVVYYAVMYNIARLLFRGKRENTALMLVFALLVNLFTYTAYTSSSFLLLRTYEGKAVLGSIIVPGIFYCGLRLYGAGRDEDGAGKAQAGPSRFWWWILFLLCQSSCAISSSAMTLVPVEVGALALCIAVKERGWRPVGKAALCMLPCLLVFSLYVASSQGILTFAV